MNPRSPSFRDFLLTSAFPALVCFALPAANATILYWDGTDTTADADGGAGTWNTGSNWDDAATAGSNAAWNNTTPDSAVFVGAAGTITLGAARSAAGLSFNTGGTVISASSSNVLTIGSGGITVDAAAGSGNQIGTGVAGTGYVTLSASQLWTNNSANIFFQRDGNLVLGGNTLTFAGSGQINAAGTTTGAGNIVVGPGASVGMSGANSYSGTTTINGTLTINILGNYNANGGLGNKASNNASNLVIDGGTLRVQVASTTSNRVFTMGAGGATLEARLTGGNSGQILLTNTAAIAYTGIGDRTLTLGGNSDDAGGSTISLAIADVGGGNGNVSLVKTEAHNWTVNGTNSYTGGTTVAAGTLTMGSATALGSTSGQLTVNGGTLNMGSQNLTVGNLTGAGGVISGTSGSRMLTIGQGDNGGGDFQGVIENGSGGTTALTKTGNGTITLSGNNTYSGATDINGGTLIIDGVTSSTSLVTVAIGATLGGGGVVGGATTVNGSLKPGSSADLLTFGGSLTLTNTAATTMEIDGPGLGTGYDGVDVATSLAYDGSLTLELGTTFGLGSHTFDLFDFGSQSGSFDAVTLAGLYSGSLANDGFGVWGLTSGNETWTFTQSTGDFSLTVIPEPRAALLGSLGMLMLLRRRR